MFQRAEVLKRSNLAVMWLGATIGAAVIGLGLVGILSGKDGMYILIGATDLVLSFIFYPFGMLQFVFLSLIGELAPEETTQVTVLKILGLVVVSRRLFDLTFLGRPLRIVKAPPMIWAFLFVLSLGLSIVAAQEIYVSLSGLLTYIQLLVVFFLIIDFVRGEREIKCLLLVLILSGVVNAGLAMYQYHVEGVERVEGAIGNANRFGIIQLALLCQIAPFLRSMPARWMTPAVLLALAPIAYSVLLSFSRGAFVAAAVVIVYGFLFLRFGSLWPKAALAVVVIVGLMLAPEGIYRRIETIPTALSGTKLREGSITTRVQYLRAGIRMGLDHPVMGVGLKHFDRYVPSYANLHTIRAGGAHNMYVSIFAEAGSVGLAAFLGLLATSLMTVRGDQRSNRSWTRIETAFVNSVELGWVVLLIGGLFATLEYSKVLWILLALVMAVRGISISRKTAGVV